MISPAHSRRAVASFVVALVTLVATSDVASADPLACRREIARAAQKFGIAKMKALQKCEDAVVTGRITGPCPDSKAGTQIAKASSKLQASIAKRCGGSDHTCATTGDNDSLDSIGWNIGSCQNFENGSCNNGITHCGDIASCLLCINEAAVDQAIDLYYDAAASTSDTTIVKCQRAIGKVTVKFFESKRKALGKCADGVFKGQLPGPCPDATATSKITKAEAKKIAGICKACGGDDKVCNGGDDLTPAQIGFVPTCPAVDPPGAEPACGQAIGTLQDIVECVDCVTEYKVDCVAAAAVPAQQACPAECGCSGGGGPTTTPTPTRTVTPIGPSTQTPSPSPTPGGPATPTATSTPSNCGNNTVDPGEDCDGSDDATCPGLCQPDCTCGEACTLPNPIPNALALVAKPGIDLDTGWTGTSHDLPGVDFAPITALRVSNCDTNLSSPTCGQCDVDGPIEYPGPTNNCRCYNVSSPDTSSLTFCDPEASTCSGGESCECFYGPPLPLSSGGVPACVVNRYIGAIAGTVNIATTGPGSGEGSAVVRLRSSVHNGIEVTQPCPRCEGDITARDGLTQGTCNGGVRNGLACDTAGTHAFFGPMSFECPPSSAANIGDLDIRFDPTTTGTTSLATERPCTGAPGVSCFCNTCATAAAEACNTNADCPPGIVCGGRRCIGGANAGTLCANNSECASGSCNRPGEPTKPHACLPPEGGGPAVCTPNPDSPNESICSDGPSDSACDLEPFRGCTNDLDCNPPPAGNCGGCLPNQTCTSSPRQCFPDPIVRTGTPGTENSVIAATFCIPPTRSASINSVAGLPGPGAVLQPTRSFLIGPLCGNDTIDAGEQCDGTTGGPCPGECGIDCQCPNAICGDGIVNQPSEECDATDDDLCPGLCQANCTCAPFCGDGTTDPGEGCDDGNSTNGDGCDNNCTVTGCPNDVRTGVEECDGDDDGACPGACQGDCTCGPFCGDNSRDVGLGEECDGSDLGICQGASCNQNCTCPAFCGDNTREDNEICDGTDAAACPGDCQPDCTCPAIGELSFVVGADVDLDTGWTGTSHDFTVQEGTRIDGVIGACSPVVSDFECTYFANVGSFCSGDPARSCVDSTQCVGAGSCVINTYGPPLPLSSGGIPVCIVNRHTGDVTGTFNLQDGSSATNVPLNSLVHLSADVSQPCPICDCGNPDPQTCQIGESGTCSDNPLINCTVEGIGAFGPTSNQCPPNPGTNVSGGGLTLGFFPATTATSTFASSVACTGSGFTQYQCWGTGQSQPSACEKACDGGSNDGNACVTNAECPGGTGSQPCRPLCRPIIGEAVGEAECVLGPVDQHCAVSAELSCTTDADCLGGTGPCVTQVRRCFLDPIVRVGNPGMVGHITVATFMIPATSSPAINSTAGLPGPGAIRASQTLEIAYCGDDLVNRPSEECDGAADANCPGLCTPACTCNVVCGNDSIDFGEQCDGTANAACNPPAGACVAPGMANECECTPAVCGDGFKAVAEQCDPGGPAAMPPPDDDACPGECLATCICQPPVCGDGLIEGAEVCELPAIGCGPLQVCVACTQCAP